MMNFDVLVIGGGHSGTEAAAASARRGARTGLLSFDLEMIGAMSCNPSIGGLGKGHIVREIDACDGLIARATDAAGIHYRMLNRSKGSAVRGPRVQVDRRRYSGEIQRLLGEQEQLECVAGEAAELILDNRRIHGVRLADGREISARAIVLATGTFLGARIFRGEEREAGGRLGERTATRLGEQLYALGLPMGRLKTGTPPRLDGRTIDWAMLAEQPSDDEPWTMSPMTECRCLPQVMCAVTRTTPEAHAIIRASLDRSPLFTGAIGGAGPRYCPSIEDKIHRFPDRDGHQIFLEPEGLDDSTVYPNGISTSLPSDVQARLIATIPGLKAVRITTPGYAVEYDYIDPRALDHRLALRAIEGLYCAGQINGTTGYEEAAGQGLVAGANAAGFVTSLPDFTLDRATSYLGVMIDDLVLQGVTEPYRMLTARAEYRLRLRADNAETRLGALASFAGLVGPERAAHQERRTRHRNVVCSTLAASIRSGALRERGAQIADDGAIRSGFEWLRFPEVWPAHLHLSPDVVADSPVLDELVEDARYAPYLARLDQEMAAMRRDEAIRLPPRLDFSTISGLSNEMVERLDRARPATLAEASRIPGVTPAALSAIYLQSVRRAA